MWVPQFNNSAAGYPESKHWDSPAAQVEMYQHSVESKPCDWGYEHENVAGQPILNNIFICKRTSLSFPCMKEVDVVRRVLK